MRRALTLEIGMQNAGLGATLATQLFTNGWDQEHLDLT
jgi:predicted Na+-dependent transporter